MAGGPAGGADRGFADEFADEAELEGAALEQFRALASGLDGPAEWRQVVAAFGEYVDEQAPWEEFAARIDNHVEQGRPASFIRMGDGEGNVLALRGGEDPALTERCVRVIASRQLGASDLYLRSAGDLVPALHEALAGAEVIGFQGTLGIAIMLGSDRPQFFYRPIHGVTSVNRYLLEHADELELRTKTGASATFNVELLPYYGDLISGRSIGIVTSRGRLAPVLRTRLGAREVDLRLVPVQARYSRRPRDDNGHLPARFARLREELRRVEPGRLWFVAAGIPGKAYCEAIREAGGIAVDIGHVADVWAGRRTRHYDQGRMLEQWRILD